MKVSENDDRWLDDLLEQPPEIAERGFVNSVRSRLERLETLRKQVFLGTAIVWTILLFLALPEEFLTNSLQKISEFGAEAERLTQFLLNVDFQTLAMPSGNLGIPAIFLLATYAVISLQIRKW